MTDNVLMFPAHKWAHCSKPRCAGCFLCHGGLALCAHCGLLEGALTSECPHVRVPAAVADAVYEGEIDFDWRRGWHCDSPSVHSPARPKGA